MKPQIIYQIILVSLLSGTKVMAQADISMATHWYNRANYNPASITRTDYLYIFANTRQQWTGVNGAPQVYNIQASEYINKFRSAFGLSVVGDYVGATQTLNPMFSYAYRLSNHHYESLSFGISLGIFSRNINSSLFEADNINDPAIYKDNTNSIEPDFNTGIEYQNMHFTFGLASTHLSSIQKTDNLFFNANHRYGYAIYKNTSLKLFNYNLGLQVVNRYNLTFMELNTSIRIKQQTGLIKGIKEIFDVGLTYRTTKQMTVLLGMNISQDLRIGYAYDQSFIKGYYRNGTHEVMLEYRIPYKAATTRIQCGDNLYWYQ
jgi:type IX secretion system PorP/SprF family membrane protein